jgi:hypothetical protein
VFTPGGLDAEPLRVREDPVERRTIRYSQDQRVLVAQVGLPGVVSRRRREIA